MSLPSFVALFLLAGQALAQPAAPPPPPGPRPLPPEVATSHEVQGRSGMLAFTAVAGSVRVPENSPQAEVATLAFLAPPAAGPARPVTFAVNGGPGASSAWLNLGALGPWRVDASASPVSPSAAPALRDNADTWLDLTDLVFVDPPSTGYSRLLATGEDVRRRVFSVNGDVSLLAAAMRNWLQLHGRMGSPVYIVGESYGGFRAPRLVRELASAQGVGVRGVLMVSPVIDFAHRNNLWDPMPCVWGLPSQVAVVRGAAGRDAVQDAERYATGDYMLDLWRGERDTAAMNRVAGQVSALLPGIDAGVIRRAEGCLDARTFARELHRAQGQVGSLYDPLVVAADPYPAASRSYAADPVLDGLQPVFSAAMRDEYARLLKWTPDGSYELLNGSVSRQWQWGNSPDSPQSYDALRRSLAADPAFRAMVVHGLYDLVAPYMADKVLLDSIPDLGPPGRMVLRVHPGGHMFYTRDDSRAALHADAAWLFAPTVGNAGEAR